MQVENVFDVFKNVLEADRTYAHTAAGMETWMFFNHIAMTFLYDLYRRLQKADLLSQYSVKDLLMLLIQIRALKINDHWLQSEIPGKATELLKKLELGILLILKS